VKDFPGRLRSWNMATKFFLAIISVATAMLAPMGWGANSVTVVRVGFVADSSSGGKADRINLYRKAFQIVSSRNCADQAKTIYAFSVAPGTYNEVLDWYQRGLIDIAIATPGVAAYILAKQQKLKSQLMVLSEMEDGQDSYHAVIVAGKGLDISNAETLAEQIQNNKVGIVAVSPLSASGFLVPAEFFRRMGARLTRKNVVTWSNNHLTSISKLVEWNAGPHSEGLIAFVSDHVQSGMPKGLQVIPCLKSTRGEGLCDIPIPHGGIILNSGLNAETIASLRATLMRYLPEAILKAGQPNQHLTLRPSSADDIVRSKPLEDYIEMEGREFDYSIRPRLTLQELFLELHNYHLQTGRLPRIALVLSGGGAKCAYQAGALHELDKAVRQYRSSQLDDEYKKLDIGAVIGTSGGSLNALLYASADDTSVLEKSWTLSSLAAVVEPFPEVAWAVGAFTAAVSVALVLLVGILTAQTPLLWGSSALQTRRVQLILLTIVMVIIGMVWLIVLLPKDVNRFPLGLQFLRAFLRMASFMASFWLVVILYRVFFMRRHMAIPKWKGNPISDMFRISSIGVVLLLCSAALLRVSHQRPAPSESHAIEKRVGAAYCEALGKTPGTKEAMALLDRTFDRSLLKRDLIITASRLDGEKREVYFYSSGTRPSTFDSRFASLDTLQTSKVLSVAAGSSTIWPFFAPLHIDFPKTWPEHISEMYLVDGGFCHNNPIEAAVLWKATHIIVINASPSEPPLRRAGAAEAFEFLFDQAQSVDSHSKSKARVFELRPACENCAWDAPYFSEQTGRLHVAAFPGTFGFTRNGIHSAFSRGQDDVKNSGLRLMRVPSEPAFDSP
jgi:predicted acylesterase/phospholipase RssA/ABC-type phosphate/phosphonate transport system substrate-binding protein